MKIPPNSGPKACKDYFTLGPKAYRYYLPWDLYCISRGGEGRQCSDPGEDGGTGSSANTRGPKYHIKIKV